MKDIVHRLMTPEAVKLLPKSCQEFLSRTFQGKTAIELITECAVHEDYAKEPFGLPKNIESGAWHQSSTWEGWMRDIVNGFKNNETPWLEHYWSQALGGTGLDNSVGIAGLTFRAAPLRAQDYWDQYVLPLWKEGNEESQTKVLGFFGRVVHLLQDMGTPAHVNNDCHMALDVWEDLPDWLGLGKIDDDDFEDYAGG